MTLSPGTRLGHYEVAASLGAGGMGEVYRAKDTRLDRTVAIKLLPPQVAQDPDRLARFEREARTISSLNHPHICTLHDVGEEAGSHFLVMELLEGESLADRLQRGPLPLDLVVKYGAQVAEALDCAHKQGIVHRDLKPGNVVLTRSGAKLLDFGLARSTAEAFSTQRQGGRRIFWQTPDGAGAAEKIDPVADPSHDTDGSWSPDGRVLAHTGVADSFWRIFVLRPGGGRPERFLSMAATNWEPRFSPDGRCLAYSSDESGRFEVHVRSFPDAGHRVQASIDGGHDPVWARNGRKAHQLYAVRILRAEPLSFGEPQLLFEGPYMDVQGAANYDVAPDGQRFLMVRTSEEEQRPTRLEVVLNWFEELKARSSENQPPEAEAHP